MRQNSIAITPKIQNDPEPPLVVRLLGACEIVFDNHHLSDLGSRKAQALFSYLAVVAKPVARETLAALLWPEMSEKAAKNNLRTTLTMLNKRLGPYLEVTTTNIAFGGHLTYTLDVELLRSGIDAAIATGNLGALQAAVSLYQGEFLEGFHVRNAEPFEEWVLQQREQLHLLVLHALERLTALCVERGEQAIGLDAGHALLTLEPWSEVAHRQMMKLLATSGQRSLALAQYNRCRQTLADELGVEPMPETMALYEQIKTGTFDEGSLADESKGLVMAASSVNGTASRKLVVAHNLLAPLSKFIGRTDELAFIHERLTADGCRLLTIIGPGGIGKSSLALEAGWHLLDSNNIHFPDGIFFIALAGIGSVDDESVDTQNRRVSIITTIAESIGCQLHGNQPAQTQLQAYLQPRRLLLILDNFEQLVGCTDLIVTLLTNAPDITMLITSRLCLNVRGETILTLKGLSLPATNDMASFHEDLTWQRSEAVALFIERAQCLDPSLVIHPKTMNSIVQICQAVDGLPLALEMIVAWVNVYSYAEIADKLAQDYQEHELLISPYLDHPQRHQALQTVFDDSWKLLAEDLQRTLAQLSIFVSQFTRQAAQTIAGVTLSTLKQLRDHSLLQIDADGIYSLHPLIKQFAAQKWQQLTAPQPEQRYLLRRAHSSYFLQEVENLAETLRGEKEVAAIRTLQKHHVEIVRGWQWAIQQEDRTLIQRTMFGLFRYLELTNQTIDGKALFDMGTAPLRDPTTAWLSVAHCHFLRRLAEHDQARNHLEKLITRISSTDVTKQEWVSTSLRTEAVAKIEAQVTRQEEDTIMDVLLFALSVLGWVYYEQGNYDAAYNCFSIVHRQAAADQTHVMQALNGLGAVSFSTKQYAAAQQHYQAALTHARRNADLHYTAIALGNLAAQAQATNAYDEAEHYLQMRLEIDQRTQNVRQMAVSYQRLGQLALLREAYAQAEAYFDKSLVHFEQLGNSPEIAHVLLDLSKSFLRQNQLLQAETACMHSLQLAHHAQMTPRILSALTLLAEIRIAEGRKDEAAALLQMVNRKAQIPAMAHKTAKKLWANLLEELGEGIMMAVSQTNMGQSLQEFSLHLLLQEHNKN